MQAGRTVQQHLQMCSWVNGVGVDVCVGDNNSNRNNNNNNKNNSQPTFVYRSLFDILPYYNSAASLSLSFSLCLLLWPLPRLRLQFFVNFRFTSHT